MPKRFTETDKWRDPWYRKLSPAAKCLWQWLVDNCDGAGVIDPDLELAAFQIGTDIDQRVVEELGNRYQTLHTGKWWIPGFIRFQYGELKETCAPHRSVLSLLEKHDLRVNEPLAKGKVRDKEKDKGKERVQKRVQEGLGTKARGTLEEIAAQAAELGLEADDGQWFFDKCEGCGWKNNGKAIKDWRATMRAWHKISIFPSQKRQKATGGANGTRQAWQIQNDIDALEADLTQLRGDPANLHICPEKRRQVLTPHARARADSLKAKIEKLKEEKNQHD